MTDKMIIEDGFGSTWSKCHEHCGLNVVRPGKVQCECDGIHRYLTQMMKRFGYDPILFHPNSDRVEFSLHKAEVLRLIEALETHAHEQSLSVREKFASRMEDDGKTLEYGPFRHIGGKEVVVIVNED